MIGYHTATYEKYILMGGFNLKSEKTRNWQESDKNLQNFIDRHLFNSMKAKTCFKSLQGACIDLIISNQRRSLQHTLAIETGLSDFHLLAYTMLKTTFSKYPPKKIRYRCWKKFWEVSFLSDLKNSLSYINGNYTSFQQQISNILKVHVPLKKRILGAITSPMLQKPTKANFLVILFSLRYSVTW